MKNKKSTTPPAPIICRLNNEPEKYRAHAVIFSLINLLIEKKEACVMDYFEYLNYFSHEQYKRFATRIADKRNKELPVNQEYFIVFYAMLHLTIQLHGSKSIIDFLKEALTDENLDGFEKSNNDLIIFCNKTLDELRKGYKNNNAMIVAIAKIEAYRIRD
jgi:hypothetical protein